MGIQLKRGNKKRSVKRNTTRSKNLYINLLVKIYRFLARKTKTKFNITVLKRLFSSRSHQSPISLSRLGNYSDGKKILVIVGKVLNDERTTQIPKLTVCALKISSSAKERILKNGGEILTFDQLAKISPSGKGTVLLRGRKKKKGLNVVRNLVSKKKI